MLRLTVSETAFGIVRRFIGLTGGVPSIDLKDTHSSASKFYSADCS
jgi:hypothetical protein